MATQEIENQNLTIEKLNTAGNYWLFLSNEIGGKKEDYKILWFDDRNPNCAKSLKEKTKCGDIIFAHDGKGNILRVGKITSDYRILDNQTLVDVECFDTGYWCCNELKKENITTDILKLITDNKELIAAINECLLADKIGSEEKMTKYPLNQILYGPPGTGKTYSTVFYAVAICEGKEIEDLQRECEEEAEKQNQKLPEVKKINGYTVALRKFDDLKASGRIAFTTFHQSYGYEEFIEGIKPIIDDDSSVGYDIMDGIFKEFCKLGMEFSSEDRIDNIDDNAGVWYIRLGGSWYPGLHEKCMNNNEIRIGWPSIDYERDKGTNPGGMTQVKHFVEEMQIGDIVLVPKYKKYSKSTVGWVGKVTSNYEDLHDDDKASKTRKVVWLAKNIELDIKPYNKDTAFQVTSTIYKLDNVKSSDIKTYLKNNSNSEGIENNTKTQPKVFIIDEINRGNISKIFGELITLIEDTKRDGASEAMSVTLPYSGESFNVPNNVYIIGTMNTADRSIALMDTALRRRFQFVEMMPDSNVLDGIIVEGINIKKMLEKMNDRIEYLFDREHTLGHAFFTKLKDEKNQNIKCLAEIFKQKIIPLLQEYFFDDYEKIGAVLGDNYKYEDYRFVKKGESLDKNLFGIKSNIEIDEDKQRYEIKADNPAFKLKESYIGIYDILNYCSK